MWANNFWVVSHSREHLEQMLKHFIEEAARVDLEAGKSVVDEHPCF